MRKKDIVFEPSKEIREFNGRDHIGKVITFECEHVNNGSQYIRSKSAKKWSNDPLHFLSGWVKKIIGAEKSTFKRKIVNVQMIEHMNGGRSSNERHQSYAEFFNEDRKRRVRAMWTGGLEGRLSGAGGDADQADLIVTFKDFELDSHCYSLRAPEEWYSELHADNQKFKFESGFYADAAEATKFFADKPVDDLFGERYFPVLVFPETALQMARDIATHAKACSKPIVTNGRAILGTRCKPYEYPEVIARTYEHGGQVARGLCWDWD